jgi:hypothetical protein
MLVNGMKRRRLSGRYTAGSRRYGRAGANDRKGWIWWVRRQPEFGQNLPFIER